VVPMLSAGGHDGEVAETFDPGTVDLVSIPKCGAFVGLNIVQDCPWTGSDDQLTTAVSLIDRSGS
jgi:hypothetical protein